MFHDLSAAMTVRMRTLEQLDRDQRAAGEAPSLLIRAVPPETGKLLALLAASAPAHGAFVELGTGAGYSTMWLSLAARHRSPAQRLLTFERDPHKATLARETFALTDIAALVELQQGDVLTVLPSVGPVAFAFMDHGPHNYAAAYEPLVSALVSGGLLAVDNIESHPELCAPLVASVHADTRLDATVLRVGKGLLLARRCS
jgi:caffeoyl-CoA O-methyltransferase